MTCTYLVFSLTIQDQAQVVILEGVGLMVRDGLYKLRTDGRVAVI